jgi:hypothetical protein
VLLHLTLSKFFYSPTEAQVNCLKINFKIYIKIVLKTSLTCSGAVTPSSGSALLVLASMSSALPDDDMTAPKHVRAVLRSILM